MGQNVWFKALKTLATLISIPEKSKDHISKSWSCHILKQGTMLDFIDKVHSTHLQRANYYYYFPMFNLRISDSSDNIQHPKIKEHVLHMEKNHQIQMILCIPHILPVFNDASNCENRSLMLRRWGHIFCIYVNLSSSTEVQKKRS
mgnify:CR=1 FL=1